jgi:hypothetical protein
MTLEIVWRNPVPPPRIERRVEPIAMDDRGALYAVRCADEIGAFELILGGAA